LACRSFEGLPEIRANKKNDYSFEIAASQLNFSVPSMPDLHKINRAKRTFQSKTNVCGLDFVCRQRYFIHTQFLAHLFQIYRRKIECS